MKQSEVLRITVSEVDGECGEYLAEVIISTDPVTLTGAMCEANYKINEAVNRTGKFPKNAIWTMVCEMVGEKLLEDSEK